MVCIPTGAVKSYALHYMIASVKNIDWGNMELHIFYTVKPDGASKVELARMEALIKTVDWRFPVELHLTYINEAELKEPFLAILKNRRAMRGIFLDRGDFDYMLILGGDNPPHRHVVKHFLSKKGDVVFGVTYQRPGRDAYYDYSYPLVWEYAWDMRDLEKYPDLEPELREQFRLAFLCSTLQFPTKSQEKEITYVCGGDGNALFSKAVLSEVGWAVPYNFYHSEDIHFMNWANILGFKVVCCLDYRTAHIHDDGEVY